MSQNYTIVQEANVYEKYVYNKFLIYPLDALQILRCSSSFILVYDLYDFENIVDAYGTLSNWITNGK